MKLCKLGSIYMCIWKLPIVIEHLETIDNFISSSSLTKLDSLFTFLSSHLTRQTILHFYDVFHSDSKWNSEPIKDLYKIFIYWISNFFCAFSKLFRWMKVANMIKIYFRWNIWFNETYQSGGSKRYIRSTAWTAPA